MSDKVIFQDQGDDALDEANLSQRRARSNASDYVERGVAFTADYPNLQLAVATGHAIVRDGDRAYDVFPDARDSSTEHGAIQLSDNATNEIYLVIDPATDDWVEYQSITDGSTPSNPSLKVGEVDTSADTSTELNRAPSLSSRSVDTEQVNNTKHWVPTGSDQTEINSIIADADPGDTVVFEEGTYQLTAPVTDNGQNNISLVGPGGKGATLEVDASVQESAIDLRNVSGWEITGLHINGNGDQSTDGGNNNKQVGIYCKSVSDSWVHHNIVENTRYANIRFNAVNSSIRRILVTDNICDTTIGGSEVAADNISLTSHDPDAVVEDWLVGGNHCVDCGWEGIELSQRVKNGIVANNTVVTPERQAIIPHDGKNVAVVGNTVRGAGAAGVPSIYIDSPGSLCAANTVVNAQDNGIDINKSKVTAIGNEIVGSADTGLGVVAADCTVTANVIQQSNHIGINIAGDNVSVGGNTVISPASNGIRVDAQRCAVTRNHVSGSSENGLRVLGDNVTVGSNILNNNGWEGVSVVGGECQIGFNILSNNRYGVFTNSTDTNLVHNIYDANTEGRVNNNGTRTRWNGVIGGGALAGVDLASVNGQYEGDRAVADGTSAANAGDQASWDSSNTQWRVFQPATTI